MTMVVGCLFKNEGIMVADSRASWGISLDKPEDMLQKILPVGFGKVIGYSGSVNIATRVISDLRTLIQRKKSWRIFENVVRDLQGLSKYNFINKSTDKERESGLSLILSGRTSKGKLEFWTFNSPLFKPELIKYNFTVIG